MNAFNSLVHQPVLNFEVGNDRCAGPFGDLYGIAHVTAVSMGDQNIIGFDLIGLNGDRGLSAIKGSTSNFVRPASIRKQACPYQVILSVTGNLP